MSLQASEPPPAGYHISPMRIGSVELAQPFSQAGLAGYSDRAMRLVARRRGCPYAVTEALLDVILLCGGQGLKKSIDINDDDHPVAGQIMGSEPADMAEAARILAGFGYDVIDVNFACPVKKVKNRARGGHMLSDVPRAVSILKAVRDALPPHVPAVVKLRRSFDETPEAQDAFFRILDAAWEAGYDAATVHARTVEQKYVGPSRWPFLTALKAAYPGRTILGSGDIFAAEDVVRMLKETGVDGVSVARGAIGNPWIFQHAAWLLSMQKGDTPAYPAIAAGPANKEISRSVPLLPPTIHEQREALREHFGIAMEIHGEQLAARRMRKMGIKYSRFHPQASLVKEQFINVLSLRQWSGVLERWYGADAPGVWPDPKAADEVNASCEP